jgi:fumarate reductase flavoprotein subunit
MCGYQAHGYVCARYGTRLAPEIPFLGGIVVNASAQRFVREDQGYSEFAPIVLGQPGKTAVEIFDQRIYDILSPTIHFQETVKAGALRSGHSVEELAAALNLEAAALRATMESYAHIVTTGHDPLGRELLGPALEPPYYGAVITGALAHTQGGLRVDEHARVLREDGTVVPNLYAGGGSAAGISGDGPEGYLSGNGLLTALGFGLIAGEHAAAALRSDQ